MLVVVRGSRDYLRIFYILSTMVSVFVFGNPDLAIDALPLRLLSALRKRFPDTEFVTLDPNEDWEVPEHMVIIDTVVGLTEPAVFTDLGAFVTAPRLTCHDFDAYANLLLLKKLGKLEAVTIFGLPPAYDEVQAMQWLESVLALHENRYRVDTVSRKG